MKSKKSFKARFLTVFGDMKLQWWPPFFYYEPGDYYKVTGDDTDEVKRRIRPGDILLRGYRNYLDGKFIPGKYSHTGIYIGNGLMIHSTAEGVGWISATQFLRCDRVMLLRPKWGQEKAVYRLNKWIGKDYDFEFKSGNEFFYCHELGAEAYQELGIEKLIPSNWISKILGFFGIKFEKVYLAESFIQNENFSSLLKFGK